MALPVQRCWSRLRALTLPLPAAGYHARPRTWGLDKIHKPDPEDPETKFWEKGPAYEAKLYGRHGSASGVRPEALWPSPEQLQAIEEEEREWYPSLKEMLDSVEAKEREVQRKKAEKEKLIAANMAKMPKMVEDWRKAKQDARLKEQEEKARKERLLAHAREKLGVEVDYRSPKFQEMVKEMEKEEKKKLKALKRRQREEERATLVATLQAVQSENKSPS